MNANDRIEEVERILEYAFVDKLLCAQGLQMAGPTTVVQVEGQIHLIESNKRLAILGDAVATQILCKAWFRHRDQAGTFQTPAEWTNIRQGTLNNGALAALGTALGIGPTIIASPGHSGPPGTVMMATVIEALIGAVYEDGGEDAVTRVMNHVGLSRPLVMAKNLKPHLQQLSGLITTVN